MITAFVQFPVQERVTLDKARELTVFCNRAAVPRGPWADPQVLPAVRGRKLSGRRLPVELAQRRRTHVHGGVEGLHQGTLWRRPLCHVFRKSRHCRQRRWRHREGLNGSDLNMTASACLQPVRFGRGAAAEAETGHTRSGNGNVHNTLIIGRARRTDEVLPANGPFSRRRPAEPDPDATFATPVWSP
jgi:hypothetical protein